MLATRRIPTSQWMPDRPDFASNPGINEAKNVIPQADSYRSLNGLNVFSAPVDNSDDIKGAYWARDDNQTVVLLAGTSNALYQLSGSTWSDISKVGGYSGVTRWEFATWGVNVIAVAAGVPPQIIDLSAGTPQFADLGGSPPNAQRVAVIDDFVIVGDLDSDSDTLQWSGNKNESTWATSKITQAGSAKLYGRGGKIQKIVPLLTGGLIFQENAIRSMQFIGPAPIFQILPVETDRGTPAPDSVVYTGDDVFWYAQDGFFRSKGGQTVPIGEERVNRWFLENASVTDIPAMVGAVDRANRVVTWAFKSNPASTTNDLVLIYNYSTDQWSYGEVLVRYIAEARTAGLTLDQLDTPLPLGIDDDSIAVESQAFKGGNLTLLGFNLNTEAATFQGSPLTATVDTVEFDGENNHRVFVNTVRPLVEGNESTAISVTLGGRGRLVDPVIYDADTGVNDLGEAAVHRDARYMRVRTTIENGFEHFSGVDIIGRPSGRF